MKKQFSIILAFALLLSIISFPDSNAYAAKTLKVKNVTNNKLMIYTGAAFSLKTNATKGQAITFSSSNKKTATVSATGTILAKKKGNTTITVKNITTNSSKKIKVSVKKSPYYSLSKTSGNYNDMTTITLKAKKGYNLYYTTTSSFSKKRYVKAGKSKSLTLTKTTKLYVYAVKKGAKVSLKTLNKKRGKNKYSSFYYYTITSVPTLSESASQSTISPADLVATSSPTTTVSPTSVPPIRPTVTATPNPVANQTDSSVTTLNTAPEFSEEELSPQDDPVQYEDGVKITLSSTGWESTDTSKASIENDAEVENNTSLKHNVVTISSSGTYLISGAGSDTTNSQIKVKKGTKDVILLINNLNIKNDYTAPVLCNKNCTVTITLAKDSVNSITGPKDFQDLDTNNESATGAVIYAKGYDEEQNTLLLNGSGTLTVNSQAGNAIQSKGALRIAGGKITVTSSDDGIQGKDYVAIAGGTINVTTEKDGIKATNESDGLNYGYIDLSGGTLTVTAAGDGLQAVSTLNIRNNPTLHVTTNKSNTNTDSMKGLKVEGIASSSEDKYVYGLLSIQGGDLTIDTTQTASSSTTNKTSDDCIHSNSDIEITGGILNLSSADDAIHADGKLLIRNGDITIPTSYEGLEASIMYLDGGNIQLHSTDDGINIAGGDSSNEDNPWQTNPGFPPFSPGAQTSSNDDYILYINGGNILVNSDGDGLDANGSIYMNGGNVTVFGPTDNGNAALDYDNKFQLNGGTLLAVGSSGMAMSPDSSSTQYSLMCTFSTQNANTLFHIQDTNGNNVLTIQAPKSYSSVVYSSPSLVNGSSYEAFTGGSATGTIVNNIFDSAAIYTQGTSIGSTTLSSYKSTIGSSSSNRPGGVPRF